ncbi:hypothetical protein PRBRB14_22830 [Hallella multisaccharivorax DSM 17128]|nr:hypothetical protein PRBRB14_22830 [Hallella multisaccharivorax DSM 17128]
MAPRGPPQTMFDRFIQCRVAPCGPPQAMFDRFIIGYDVSSGRAQGPTLHYKEWLAIAKM